MLHEHREILKSWHIGKIEMTTEKNLFGILLQKLLLKTNPDDLINELIELHPFLTLHIMDTLPFTLSINFKSVKLIGKEMIDDSFPALDILRV